MSPGDAPTSPLPLGDRIIIALDQLRLARTNGDPAGELKEQLELDELLDEYPRRQS